MTSVFKSVEGERKVRKRYFEFLNNWPVRSEHVRLATREGETFVVVSGREDAPPLLLFHGSVANSAMWVGDIAAWAQHFRIYAVDMIGEAGLSAPSRPPLDSEAHALWLDDVMAGLSLRRASIAGVSLGGWLALDYAVRRPERVHAVAVLCPGGIGRQKIGFLFRILPLLLLGSRGRRKAAELVLGRMPADASPAARRMAEFFQLIHENFRPRRVKLPVFSDDVLRQLKMPLMAIVGGKDMLIDSADTRNRLERNVAHAEIRYLPEAGHFIPGQTAAILDFLNRALSRADRRPDQAPAETVAEAPT